MLEQMYQFQAAALGSTEDPHGAVLAEDATRIVSVLGGTVSGVETPGQEQLRSIKAQQTGLSREREKAIQAMEWRSMEPRCRAGLTAPVNRTAILWKLIAHINPQARSRQRESGSARPHRSAKWRGRWPSP